MMDGVTAFEMESKVDELGVIVDNNFGNKPQLKAKRCNAKLKCYREFGLATLCSLAKENLENADKGKAIRACDAVSGCGITGLQWKKHLQELVDVTLADQGDLTKLKTNVVANSLEPAEIQLDGRRLPGDPHPDPTESQIHVCCAEAKALLIMESFQFIFLNPHKGCVNSIESAFQNITNGGIICVVVPDTSVFSRSPHVVQRCYAADVIKTEYLKELAARVILASMARAAARCNKGMSPLYVVTKDDYLLISVRVQRGHGASDSTLKEITNLLHCRFCEERVFVEKQLAPDENPYSKMPCQCKARNTGKSAVLIGPMWKGPIFNSDFLSQLQTDSKGLPLGSSFHELLSLLVTESLCLPPQKIIIPHQYLHDVPHDGQVTNQTNIDVKSPVIQKHQGQSNTTQEFTCNPDQSTLDLTPEVKTHYSPCLGKRESHSGKNEQDFIKKVKPDSSQDNTRTGRNGSQSNCNVPFYHHIKKCKRPTLPKLDQIVSLLQKAGYLASRTHFDPCCIRTTATVEQFLAIL